MDAGLGSADALSTRWEFRGGGEWSSSIVFGKALSMVTPADPCVLLY